MHVFVGESQVFGQFLEGALARQRPVSSAPRVVVGSLGLVPLPCIPKSLKLQVTCLAAVDDLTTEYNFIYLFLHPFLT